MYLVCVFCKLKKFLIWAAILSAALFAHLSYSVFYDLTIYCVVPL